MSETQTVIRAEGLTKSYGSFVALRGIDLEVARGEIFGFLGPNGAGKTTAIRCMLDLIRPGGGLLRVLGVDPQREPVAVRARCGYLPGELRLDENVPVATALRFFQELRGGGRECRERAEVIAERLGLKMDARIKNLSKGNKQKVGIVAAFMHAPELLLLDEPTSGLDPLVQQTVLELVREARDGGATVFFSSHVLAEVQSIADRVAIIRAGEIVEHGSTAQLTGGGLVRVSVRLAMGARIASPELDALSGVRVLGGGDDGEFFDLEVEGGMDGLLKLLAKHEVRSLDTRRPSLEEVFLAHYGNGEGGR
jgi:ABC-2 type transport system ATP-binding protein